MNDLYLLGEPFRMQLYWETMQKRFLKFLKYPQDVWENKKDRIIYTYILCVCVIIITVDYFN